VTISLPVTLIQDLVTHSSGFRGVAYRLRQGRGYGTAMSLLAADRGTSQGDGFGIMIGSGPRGEDHSSADSVRTPHTGSGNDGVTSLKRIVIQQELHTPQAR